MFIQNPDAVVFAGVESTGGYESNWYNTLMSLKDTLNIQVARLNPLGVKRNIRAKELINSAKESTGADQDEVAQFRLKSLAQQIYHLRQLIKEQNDQAII